MRFSIYDLENFYTDPASGYADHYVVPDPATGVSVDVSFNTDAIESITDDALRAIAELGEYDDVTDDLARGLLRIDDKVTDIDIAEGHCSDSGLEGWMVCCEASVLPPDAKGAWADPIGIVRAETSVPAGDDDFDIYHAACWNRLMREFRSEFEARGL